MTQKEDAKKGILTEEMKHVAKIENKSEYLILSIKHPHIVNDSILNSPNRLSNIFILIAK